MSNFKIKKNKVKKKNVKIIALLIKNIEKKLIFLQKIIKQESK